MELLPESYLTIILMSRHQLPVLRSETQLNRQSWWVRLWSLQQSVLFGTARKYLQDCLIQDRKILETKPWIHKLLMEGKLVCLPYTLPSFELTNIIKRFPHFLT